VTMSSAAIPAAAGSIRSAEIFVAASAVLLALAGRHLATIRIGFRRRVAPDAAHDPLAWPTVDVVVPVHEEAAHIAEKIANLKELDYPAERLAFWIVDGSSVDGTAALAASAFDGDPRFSILNSRRANKTAQLNAALRRCRSPWVLFTDADARFVPGTLKELVREAGRGTPAGAVGSVVVPVRSHPWEALHWRIADRIRLAEAAACSASIVTGPCYLMRRDLLAQFPAGVAADDVHVAFRSAAAGLRTGFTDAGVVELRCPVSIAEMVRHKYRKGRAYLTEIFRFLPAAPRIPAPFRTIFLRRASHVLLAPVVGFLLAAAAATTVARSGMAGAGVGAGLALAAGLLLAFRPTWRSAAGLAVVLAGVIAAAIFSLPFHRQRASFRKIDARRRVAPDVS
jgi:hypothetical protein